MNYNNFLEKLECLKKLIEIECTGTAEECAEKLNFSRRTLFNYLDILKLKFRSSKSTINIGNSKARFNFDYHGNRYSFNILQEQFQIQQLS